MSYSNNQKTRPTNSITNSISNSITNWCKPALCNFLSEHGFDINNNIKCRYGPECKGAHRSEQISIKSTIITWRKTDKSLINLFAIRKNIIDVYEQNKEKIVAKQFRKDINTMKLDEILSFWYSVTCYHRKIANDIVKHTNTNNEYTKLEQIPLFELNDEENVWMLERTTHLCKNHMDLMSSKDNNEYFDCAKLCVGSHNCKSGVHLTHEVACIDDMIKGQCNCLSVEEIEVQTKSITAELDKYNLQLIYKKDNDGFETKLSSKVITSIKVNISILEQQLKQLYRKVHYTELGMIPYITHEIRDNIIKAEAAKELELKQSVKKPIRVITKVKI